MLILAIMRNGASILLAALFISVLPSCFYSDSELYKVEPVPGDPPVISVSTNLDTLINPAVNDSLEVVYNVEIEGGELYYINAVVAGTQVFESDSINGSFWIPHNAGVIPSVDTLYMDFYYSSNTNSLADITGYEARILDLKFAVFFNLLDTE